MRERIQHYFSTISDRGLATEVSDRDGGHVFLQSAIDWAIDTARGTHAAGDKLMVIGNGGSAAIASHMATDYTKNGGIRTQAFNDGATLTCLGNDLGYENVFSKQIEMFGRPGDLLVAISSSGQSANILKGVAAARAHGCAVMTLSGFRPDNPLRKTGDMNFYVGSSEYGFVEIIHLSLCHAVLDLAMGWGGAETSPRHAAE